MTNMPMGIGNLFPIKEREQISSGTVQNASKRKEKMCAYLTSTTKVKARKKLRENTVQPHKMAQNYQCQMMKTQKKLDRGTKTNANGSKYTAKQQIDTQGTKKVSHEKVKKRRKAWGEQQQKNKRATGKPKGSSNVTQFVDIKDETAVKSVRQQEDTKVTFPTAEISKEIGCRIETMQSESKSSAKQPLDVKITNQANLK